MTKPTKIHTLKLTNGSVLILKNSLPQPMWFKGKSWKLGYDAIEIVENLSVLEVPEKMPKKEEDEWLKQEYVLEVTEGQREAMKQCLTYLYKEGKVILTVDFKPLIRELGLLDGSDS